MNILALDMATRTGWACSSGISGVQSFAAEPDLPNRLVAFREWLVSKLLLEKPDIVVYERAHFRGAATRSAMGFETVCIVTCCQNGTPTTHLHTATLKKHATGNGRATKDEMMAAAIKQHPTVRLLDDNHVDALWLLHWAHSNLSEDRDAAVRA